jgi:hypothetical protein
VPRAGHNMSKSLIEDVRCMRALATIHYDSGTFEDYVGCDACHTPKSHFCNTAFIQVCVSR